MKTLKEIVSNPSGFDSMSNYMGDEPDDNWFVVLTRSRDSDTLTESNWECALKELGGEGDDVEILRYGHWGCGWWEVLAVRGETDAAKMGQEIVDALSDYPVLDEQHHSELESEEANRIWESCFRTNDRIEHLRKHRCRFDSFADLLGCVRGNHAPWGDSGFYGIL